MIEKLVEISTLLVNLLGLRRVLDPRTTTTQESLPASKESKNSSLDESKEPTIPKANTKSHFPDGQKNHTDPIVFCVSEKSLRTTNLVRPLRALESGKRMSTLPNGIFGYVYFESLDRGSDESLERERKWFNVEAHKDAEGRVSFLLYVSEESKLQLQDPTQTAVFPTTALSEPFENYTALMALPRSRLLSCESRTFRVSGESRSAFDLRIL